ncbi:hypothetical protein L6Q21_09470 [Sandaracinobacter sp. RS1-74]|uniref:hypothetical protein n=1 Tax=Sandaracinobacteroides sayramensis TaxID=2913411 RepID=UPI001EDB92DA|nr:hypothetical protein [Sandaracinobacteroides sayramensis]MCG2841207.1 hypothetical protein [Sandaracinobacteroides sayramensis]
MLLAGCTSLSTTADRSTGATNKALVGVPYSLPMLQYDIKITRTLAQCVDPTTKIPALKFTMTAEATPHYVAGETFVIDYRRLAGFTKITSFAIEYQESSNILKSINATAEDRTAEIIGNTVKTAVGIASLAAGVPGVSKAPDGTPLTAPGGILVCGPKTQGLLDAVTLAADNVKTKAEALKKATANVDALASRAASLSDADKTELTKRVGLQTDAIKALATAQSALDQAKDKISLVTAIRWPRAMDDDADMFLAEGAAMAKLTRLVAWSAPVPGADLADNACDAADQVSACVSKKLGIFVKLDRFVAAPEIASPGKGRRSPIQEVSNDAAKGVFIRPPVQGRLLICGDVSQSDCREDGPVLLLKSDDVSVPQLGTLRFLPFENHAFQNNALVLTLAASGDVSKLEYKNLKAQGESASAAALAAVTDIRGFADSLSAKRAADKKAAADAIVADRTGQLAAIQFEIDRLQKENTLTALQEPSAIAVMQNETAERNARIALLQAILSERQAEAALLQ